MILQDVYQAVVTLGYRQVQRSSSIVAYSLYLGCILQMFGYYATVTLEYCQVQWSSSIGVSSLNKLTILAALWP